MGRYFGIANSTTNEHVSSYWKGDSWCDCYQVMHQLHWEKTDEIYSACYDTLCKFEYNAEKRIMVNIENDHIDNDHIDNNSDGTEEDNEKSSDVTEKSDTEKSDTESKYYGIDNILTSTQFFEMLNHVPHWDGDVCCVCKYQYDSSKLKKYEKTFNGTYFMS